MRKIVLIGDSLTELAFSENGWCYFFQSLHPNLQIINNARCGWTSKKMSENIKNMLIHKDISTCTILLGTNDMYSDITIPEYKKYLLFIIDYNMN
jgi:lysophospholipase L1-like esterase